ncbi:MAG TPA: S8 family serine peptidase [Pseudonocardiaceae bacterium]
MGENRAPRGRRIAGLGILAGTALALGGLTALPAQAQGTVLGATSAGAIKDSYIVVYKDGMGIQSTQALTAQLSAKHKATVTHQYGTALRGFAGTMSEAEARRLAADPAVAFVEQNSTVSIAATQSPTPSWGLDRIDQRDLPLNNSYTYNATGSGVTAYIIDTGIRTSHADFGGRATWGTNTTGDGNNTDCNGHGTHVASTTGGTTYGVAKGVSLIAVKVLTCSGSGSNAGVIAGVDWVTSHHTSGPAVANMSLGGGAASALDTAVRNSIADGVTYALASGNSNTSACNSSPARVAEGITVNSTTNTDARSSFSNYGTCTDIFAPGSNITAAWYTSNTATNTISGTSMATPHVAGAVALYLQGNPSVGPSAVASALYAASTPNKVTSPGTGSPNRLLYVGGGGTEPPPPPPPGCSGTNGTDVNIPDYGSAVTSAVTISGCNRNASASSQVSVDIRHTWRGDLQVDLIAPDGSTYRLKSTSSSDSADNVIATYTVNLSSEAANGTWRLSVRDFYRYDTGYISSFGITV